LFSFLAVVDAELYKHWGYRLDTTPLLYFNTPKEMIASVSWILVLWELILWGLITYFAFRLYQIFVDPYVKKISKGNWRHFLAFLFFYPFLFIPIRSSFDLAPLNIGSAYFSENQYANHAALNLEWNIAYAFTWYDAMKNPYLRFDEKKAEFQVDKLVNRNGKTKMVLKTTRPNIVLIILESFCDKIIEPLGGLPGITPNLNKLCREGICFTRFYASGDRSDKGMVAILSGFPAQPKTSIIKFPKKTELLPFLSKDLKRLGYHFTFYYGGDIDFASMRSYFTNGGADELVIKSDFPSSTYGAKWGVHDQYVFKRLFDDLSQSRQPFIKMLFTISSHEPFDVPIKTVIKGNDEPHMYLNSAYYTDSCLGDFINKARNTEWWKNTLIIITADHGTPLPDNSLNYVPQKFRIPMLWLGGALAVRDSFVNKTGSQTDIAYTLLCQMNVKPLFPFRYSKNILDNSNNAFAYYAFNNGFGFVTDTSSYVFDNDSKKVILPNENYNGGIVKTGKEFLQVVYSDFLKR
jgi:phosphoglycerol transferase MdoB-like AlkP superfamily enzyme